MSFVAPLAAPQRRVIVTGIGIVSPLGCGVERTWKALLQGRSGVRALTNENDALYPIVGLDSLPTSLAATIPHGQGEGEFNAALYPRLPRFIQYAVAAADEALTNAGWPINSGGGRMGIGHRAGVAIGCGIGSLEDTCEADRALKTGRKGYRGLTPQFVPRILLNMAAGHVSIRHGLRGPNHTAVTACATGAHSIGDAYRFIKFGDADMMVAGGTEACVNHLSLAGFGRMRALSVKHNSKPHTASRPFDKDRDGFVLAEGAAVLVLEELNSALKRGAPILAEVRGYGLSSDGYHITAPSEDGGGAIRAMQSALQYSGLHVNDVTYVNAHATSTPLGDSVESTAIDYVFGERADLNLERGNDEKGGDEVTRAQPGTGSDNCSGGDDNKTCRQQQESVLCPVLVSSTKGATGHLLGAAGALEAAFAVLAIRDGIIPHTLNLHQPEEDHRFQHVMGAPKAVRVQAAMSNSFGFGGTNVSLLFSHPPEEGFNNNSNSLRSSSYSTDNNSDHKP